TCTCLGACHHAAAAAWLGSDAPRLRVVARAFLETAAPAGRPAISRTLHPHVLPFATAPPAPVV
ncbi:MAG TPA: hypothetical protein VGE02_07080, partial [Gemmatimonadales bacterium]